MKRGSPMVKVNLVTKVKKLLELLQNEGFYKAQIKHQLREAAAIVADSYEEEEILAEEIYRRLFNA
jgi:hypothetical protein